VAEGHSTQERRGRGVVLVAVLWILALLGIVAASFLRETRIETRVTRNLVENARAEALADAGVERAKLGLLDPDDETVWRADGTPYEFSFGEGRIRVTLQSEAGKIDLNEAPDETLLALFEVAGLSAADAVRFVDAIADFRDPDIERRPAGAEGPDYAAAGFAQGAKNAPFETVDELLQVFGMTRELYDRLAPNVTVYPDGQIDPTVAPPMVLQVLRQLMPEQLDQMLDTPRDEVGGTLSRPRTVTILVEATTAGGTVFTRTAVIQRTEAPAQPFRVLEWRQSWQPPPAVAAGGPTLDQ
jgi:general secretion pathway protein K